MANKEKGVKQLQLIVTDLSRNALMHEIHGRIFNAQGFSKLGEKYIAHAAEEREWVSKAIDLILDMDGEVKQESVEAGVVCPDPIEFLKMDCKTQAEGIVALERFLDEGGLDVRTEKYMKEYYEDEYGDLGWDKQQLDLIERIGAQNWLLQQL